MGFFIWQDLVSKLVFRVNKKLNEIQEYYFVSLVQKSEVYSNQELQLVLL